MDERKTLPGGVRARLGSLVAQGEEAARRSPSLKGLLKPAVVRAPRPRPSRAKTHEESFRDLDAYYEEAVAGMPDEALARAANTSLTAVLAWRKLKKIARRKGWERRRETEAYAIDVFGDGYVSDVQAAHTRLKAQWDLPEYVLRVPLNYDSLTRASFFLHYGLGMTPDEIASAIGLRPRDVEMAISVEVAHLGAVGEPCEACGRSCDPAYGPYCSTRCRSEKK